MANLEIPYKFRARPYQVEMLKEIEKASKGLSDKRYFYQIWHRRSGKDKTCMADIIPRRLIQDPCQVKYVYPTTVMGRTNLWEAIDKDGFKFIDHLPREIRDGQANETRMLVKVKNGTDVPSLFQVVGANNPDSLRGGNPKLFAFSEWADHDPYTWDVVEPILRENDGIAVFNTTPKGDNHARALYEYAKDHPKWFVQTLTVEDTGIFTKEQMDEIKEDTIKRFDANGRGEAEALAYIEQEYYCSFDSPVIGSYYGIGINKAEDEGRIGNVPYDDSLPVHTFWDLGIDDSTTIWFMQSAGQELRLIDYHEGSGEGLAHYAGVLQEKGYNYGDHYAPHDIEVRELSTGKSRREMARKLGINFKIAPRLSVEDGINAVRSVLSRCWFDKKKTNRGLQALKNYKHEWDDKNMVYRKAPLHDWSSHGADAFRYFAVSFKKKLNLATPEIGGVLPYLEGIG